MTTALIPADLPANRQLKEVAIVVIALLYAGIFAVVMAAAITQCGPRHIQSVSYNFLKGVTIVCR